MGDYSIERASHPSSNQVEMLLNTLESRPILAKGISRSLCSGTREQIHREWTRIAMKLNSMGGASKSTTQWMKYWRDKRAAVKKKAVACAATTGGADSGDSEEVAVLSATEKRIVALMVSSLPNNIKEEPSPASVPDQPPVFDSTAPHRKLRVILPASPPSKRVPQFKSITQKLMQLEESRLAMDEQVAKYNLEREQVTAQSALAQAEAMKILGEGMKVVGEGMKVVGEGMKALAEAIKKD